MFTSDEKIMLPCPPPRPLVMDRRWKANVELAPNCPRCDSSNTKFCYYNNYSLTQPRYFCKGCRRYWTKGGSLRNVPVGGGCRKNRRGKSVRISTDRVTMGNSNYGRLVPEPDPVGNLNQLRNGSDVLSTSDSSTIDLAAVYAKFLNQRPTDSDSGIAAVPELILNEFDVVSSLDDLPNAHLEPPNHHGPSQFLEVENNDHMVLECLHPALHDHPINPEAHIGEGQQSFLGGGEFVMNEKHDQVPDMDKDGFGLQPQLPADQGVVYDIDWCQLPNFMWQSSQSTQTQELGISFPEDHLNLHSSLLNGNWSSFSQVSTFHTISDRP